jgi:CitMHS family citrate-Mg2+:H+ or citrate-Ca2+:H+ symporter
MLALLGLITIVVLLAVIMARRMSPLVALIVVPIAASLLGGFGLQTGAFVTAGIEKMAPVVAMFVFAILFFGVVKDAGMFDPLVARLLRVVGTRPRYIVPGTALLAALVHLDGSGAVTFLVVVPALLPLYQQLGMDCRLLACAAAMGAGVMNLVPWGGPTLRASAALGTPVTEIFNPLLPVLGVGIGFSLAVGYVLGRREERRLGREPAGLAVALSSRELTQEEKELRRPRLFWVNAILTLLVLGAMVSGRVPPAVAFLAGTALVLLINYPQVEMQRRRVDAHARAALMMASILMAAGVLTGVLQGSGMLSAMAQASVRHVPEAMARHIPAGLGLVSMPLSLLFDPDSFYLGLLPVVAKVSGMLGVEPVQVAQGALLGQMTTGFPVSPLTPATYLLVGLSGVDLGAHQRFSIPFLWATSVVMTVAAVVFGVLPL